MLDFCETIDCSMDFLLLGYAVVKVQNGDERTRTACLLRAKQALYQVSYIPGVGNTGLEPVTSPLSGVRSSHLS